MEIKSIPLSQIFPSPMNPRKTFDEDELNELADNIEKQGLLQPITVRPVKHSTNEFGDRPDKFEIVCGERRFRASVILRDKWKDIDSVAPDNRFGKISAIVREMTDDEAFDAMITENLQRKDVDPMEEAFAFGQLIEKGKTAEEIAARFGKSIRFVQDRVKLNSLIPELMLAVREDKMPLVSAQLICKLDESAQRAFFEDYGRHEMYARHMAQNFIDGFFMSLENSLWFKSEDPADKSFEGGCGKECSQCHLNTANHGCLFYEMKCDDAGRCTDQEKFNAKKTAYILKKVSDDSDRLVKEGEPLDLGKIVVGIRIENYESEKNKKSKERLADEIKTLGFQIVDPEETFRGRCYYSNDDERTLEMIKTGQVYHVLALTKYGGLNVEHQFWYVKKETVINDESGSMLPVEVSRRLAEIQNKKNGLQSTMTAECAKTLSKESVPTMESLTEVEKKAFCLLVLQSNYKLRNHYQMGVASYRDKDYELIEQHPDMFDQCVRAYLQEKISLGHNPELNQAAPMLDDLGVLWCPEPYQETKRKVQVKHDKQIAKLKEELSDLGYNEDGKPTAKVEKLPKSSKPWEQFEEMKRKHPDAILLFRVGDFYETFDEDAEATSKLLGITLTKRKNGKKEKYIAGFPHHALDTYLPKLIRSGRRVAICEQLEDPKLKKS